MIRRGMKNLSQLLSKLIKVWRIVWLFYSRFCLSHLIKIEGLNDKEEKRNNEAINVIQIIYA